MKVKYEEFLWGGYRGFLLSKGRPDHTRCQRSCFDSELRCGSAALKAENQAAAGQKNWKDRDEYDAFQKVQQATDPKARLEALKAWEDKYATSDFVDMRNQYFLDTYSRLAPSDPAMRQALLNKAQDALKDGSQECRTRCT